MNILKQIFAVTAIVAVFSLIACGGDDGNDEQAKDQSQTITGLFGGDYSATVNGHLTDSEWDGIANKIKTALNGAFTAAGILPLQNVFKLVFENEDIVIIVEKNPAGYSKWKTSADGKTMYLAFGALNNDLQGSVDAAVAKMNVPEAGNG